MKKCFVVVLALMLLAFASVSMAVENLPQSEVDEIVKGVENGNAEAQFRLGMMYYNGQNVKQDYEQAFYWIKKSGYQSTRALFMLGSMYINGLGVKKDYDEAFKLFHKVTNKDRETISMEVLFSDGSARELFYNSKLILAAMYADGHGTQQNYEEAFNLLKDIAEAEESYKVDYSEAFSNDIEDAAVQEFISRSQNRNQEAMYTIIAPAQFFLGELYAEIKQDYEQAEYWFQKSFENGNDDTKKDSQEYLDKIRDYKAKKSQTSIASTQQSNSDNVIEIEIEQAFKECRDNGLVYKRKYSGKKVRVSGKIFEIDTYPFSEKIFIRLSYKDIKKLTI